MVLPRGNVRDAIVHVLSEANGPLRVSEIEASVQALLGDSVSSSSIRSSLRLQAKNENSPVTRVGRGMYSLFFNGGTQAQKVQVGRAVLLEGDALQVMSEMPPCSVHAIVTDPPYGLVEYNKTQLSKLREGHGGVWRIPPSFDGNQRSPLPRFTTLTTGDLEAITSFFEAFGSLALPVLVPGANLVVASNPLVVHIVTTALASVGFEPRGQIIRLVQTMRGGDRPKGFEEKYADVSVMPRSQWEPWIVMRKPLDGTVASNLSKWGTGGWMRVSDEQPFGDVIKSSPTRKAERLIANHPSLKPQSFMRQIVRASLPLGTGIILDPFAGSGSTLAAAESLGYQSIGVERDHSYFELACSAVLELAKLKV